MSTMSQHEVRVIIGVDTHTDTHTAVAIDQVGRRLGDLTIATNRRGYGRLLAWASSFGTVDRFGIEGTGSYGAGLARWLRAEGLVVIEVERPDRKTRRFHGKSDPIDAEAAARAALAGRDCSTPKTGDGIVEMIRVLRVARRSAIKNRTMVANQLNALVLTAPHDLRDQLRDLSTRRTVTTAAAFRPGHEPDTVVAATRFAMRELARQHQMLTEQICRLDTQLHRLVAQAAPELIAKHGVGTHTAAALLVCAGDNPDRLVSADAFAHLTGTAPLDASSGRQQRHRLNTGGDRDANAAIHRIVITRLSTDPATRAYRDRRMAQGKTRREAMRCLKRYVAREVFKTISRNPAFAPG